MSVNNLKAIKILKDIKIDSSGLGLELNPCCVTDDVEFALEQLNNMIGKGCNSCKYSIQFDNYEKCEFGISFSFSNPSKYIFDDMGCNKWEQK